MSDETRYEGKSERALLIDVITEVKLIRQTLEGTPGQEGLCQIVSRHEKTIDDQDTILTKHTVYFSLIAATITVLVTLVLWGIDKL